MNSSATLTGCDDIIRRLREAIAEHPLSPIHGYAADIAALLDRLDAAERENEALRRAAQMAQGWIEEDRRLFVASASVAGKPNLDDYERAALAGYDAILAEIDAAMSAEKPSDERREG